MRWRPPERRWGLVIAVAAAFLISLSSCGGEGEQPERTQAQWIRERAAAVLGRLGTAIRQLAGQREEELAREKPIVLGDTQRGRLPPCRGMNTRGAALGPGRTSRVIKCLVDGVRPRSLRTSGKLVRAASRHGRRMVAAGFFGSRGPADWGAGEPAGQVERVPSGRQPR